MFEVISLIHVRVKRVDDMHEQEPCRGHSLGGGSCSSCCCCSCDRGKTKSTPSPFDLDLNELVLEFDNKYPNQSSFKVYSS